MASTFGMVFAPDQRRAASELARVCRPGARIVLTAWPDDAWSRMGTVVGRTYPEGEDARDWAREDRARELLGGAFELRLEPGEWRLTADSPEELWDLLSGSSPLLKGWLDSLEAGRRAEVDRAYLEFLAGGEVRREYVTIHGTRR